MATYYNTQTNEKVEARVVEDIRETFTNKSGEVTVTQGNYIVTLTDGQQIGVASDDFIVYYTKTKLKIKD